MWYRGPLASTTYHSSRSGPGADRISLALDVSISTRRQRERRRPSATPDSTASQVSIGRDTTEPVNAYASAEAWKTAPPPESDEASAKSASGQQESCHSRPRQPHRGIANRTGLSQRAVWTPSAKQVEDRESYPATFRLAATNADAFPQVSAPSPAASAAPAEAPGRAAALRRTPSPLRIATLSSSPHELGRSPPGTARSSSRT